MANNYDYDKMEPLSAQVNTTGAAVDIEIIAADADERLIPRKLIFSSSVSAKLTLKRGSTILFGPTEGILVLALDDIRSMVGDINENFNYTTDTGDSHIWVEYVKSKG